MSTLDCIQAELDTLQARYAVMNSRIKRALVSKSYLFEWLYLAVVTLRAFDYCNKCWENFGPAACRAIWMNLSASEPSGQAKERTHALGASVDLPRAGSGCLSSK